MKPLRSSLTLLGLIALSFAVAGLGGWATSSSVTSWYPTLAKPAWNPPAWLFGPVWTLLYVLMAVAAWLVWKCRPAPGVGAALRVYFGQLGLNLVWSVIFFGMRQPGLAVAEITLLWLAIAGTIILFRRHSKAAAWLMVPYLAWVTFAAVLNFTIWQLNR